MEHLEVCKAESGDEMFHGGKKKAINRERKVQSLKHLFGIVTQWTPESFQLECYHAVVSALRLGLCTVLVNEMYLTLSLLIWFKTCTLRSSEIQKFLMKQSSTVRLLLRMFYKFEGDEKNFFEACTLHGSLDFSVPKHFYIRRELVAIFTTVLAHAERLRHSKVFGNEDNIVVSLNKDPFPIVLTTLPTLLELLPFPMSGTSDQGFSAIEGNFPFSHQ